ncbi:GNAT family N-acetyltransferase [Pannonibacter indicus]|jgi:RimJ/RimL family protein N-acetyltransferase|uniref:Protein N-acetyltransferase, RimJ/RimL family n=1 Tax=Pannonibacter indicus TaxID=466044 RepID=A0A0K6HRE0_9HYPH|nr:GNAT family N-acetyltransferase [Pannonibacter indicus]CUA93577.1 Protein N-acetyltransferase, RimJ/RimL family [Pannonibacter indicus]
MRIPDCPQLSFRQFEPSDAEFLMRLMNDAAFIEHIGDRGLRQVEDARNYIRSAIRPAYRRENYGFWVISDRASGAALGMAGLAKRDNLDLPDLGYALLPEARGQGHAMAASRAVLAYGFGSLDLPRVLAITSPGNEASNSLLARLGFEIAVQDYRLPNAPGRPQLLHCLERERWERAA